MKPDSEKKLLEAQLRRVRLDEDEFTVALLEKAQKRLKWLGKHADVTSFGQGAEWGKNYVCNRLKQLRKAYRQVYHSHTKALSNEARERRKEKVLEEVRKLFE